MKKIVIALIIIAIGVAIGWMVAGNGLGIQKMGNASIVPPKENTAVTQNGTYEPVQGLPSAVGEGTKGGVVPSGKPTASATVSYTDTGFIQSIVYVKLGTSVTFSNNSTKGMWIASAPHPTHTLYPEFDQKKSVQTGGTYAFTFAKVGSWKYHNHLMPDHTGTVVVSQ